MVLKDPKLRERSSGALLNTLRQASILGGF